MGEEIKKITIFPSKYIYKFAVEFLWLNWIWPIQQYSLSIDATIYIYKKKLVLLVHGPAYVMKSIVDLIILQEHFVETINKVTCKYVCKKARGRGRERNRKTCQHAFNCIHSFNEHVLLFTYLVFRWQSSSCVSFGRVEKKNNIINNWSKHFVLNHFINTLFRLRKIESSSYYEWCDHAHTTPQTQHITSIRRTHILIDKNDGFFR